MRLLSLVLVFVLSTMASAAVSLYIGGSPAPPSVEILPDETLTIQIHSSDSSMWAGYLILEDGSVGSLGNCQTIPCDPHIPEIDCCGCTWEQWQDNSCGLVPDFPPSSGIQFEVDYSSSDTGTADISLYLAHNFDDPVDELAITVAEPGDFDTDGDIDLYDFAIFGLAWMTSPGDGNWNEDCDISEPKDNIIDYRDLSVLAEDWLAGL